MKSLLCEMSLAVSYSVITLPSWQLDWSLSCLISSTDDLDEGIECTLGKLKMTLSWEEKCWSALG